MFSEGDIKCVEELLKPAKKVLKKGLFIKHEPTERRISLWNEIRENYDDYDDEKCGKFLPDLDMHFRSQFETATLVLAYTFKTNGEDFKPAEMFGDVEIEAYEKIDRYSVFELLSVDDILKKIVSKDDEILNLFRDYYVYMDKWVDKTLENPSIRLPIRFYMKKKWVSYKSKLNEAVSKAIVELDWFRRLISQWEREAESMAEKRVKEVESEIKAEIQREMKDRLNEIKIKEKELTKREEELAIVEEKINKEREELRRIKGKVEKGSRFVEVGRAKQYEMNFIGRIERRLGKEVRLFDKTFKVESLKEFKDVDTSRFIGFKSKYGVLTERDVKNLPENRYIVAKLVEKKLFGGKKSYTLKAFFTSRIEKYAEYGFDVDPLELNDVNAYMVDVRDEAKKIGETIVLCLASPTGFEDAVKQHVSSEEFHRNFLSKYLSIILLDLETGKLTYNPYDDVAKEFAKICEMEVDAEKKAKVEMCVRNFVDDALATKDYVVLQDVLKCGDETIVRALFYEIAEGLGLRVRYVDGVGLVMMK